ncbi:hypothetical protein [Algivirga pacifica]|uniref:Arrestin-like N-terminal domain-containing protein n=1 Tax=Algivirga pacifica TaxID=1162670 RepID=A0ABP9DLM3_9BACT
MGLFDKIKSVANMVTGGAAEVVASIDHDGELVLGEPFKIRVQALAKSNLSIDKVYLKLKSEERVEVEGIEVEYEEDGEREIEHTIARKTTVTYEHELLVAGPQTLNDGETYEWEIEVSIPENNNGTYRGIHAKHEWKFFVGLDAFGNDPDTGWIPFEIY